MQKSVRDRLEGIVVSPIYYSLCWLSLSFAIALLTIGLWNATLNWSEKGFYAMAFALALFGAIAVQKNTRDNLSGMNEPQERKRDKGERPSPTLVSADGIKPESAQEAVANSR